MTQLHRFCHAKFWREESFGNKKRGIWKYSQMLKIGSVTP